jgi:predicted acetyltransferase
MEKCILIKPDVSLINDIQLFRQEMLDASSSMDGTGSLRSEDNIEQWLEDNKQYENKETVPDNFVTCDQYVFIRESDQKVMGMIQFRHYFNEMLEKYGGHIGYSIRPNERRKGYATTMLQECLVYCKAYGLDKVLITCLQDNKASERTILANGGVYESTIYYEAENEHLKRFWISL